MIASNGGRDTRPTAAGCRACGHCYCRNGVRRARRHRVLLVSTLAAAALTAMSWGGLHANWDAFNSRADTSLCRLVPDRC